MILSGDGLNPMLHRYQQKPDGFWDTKLQRNFLFLLKALTSIFP